MIKTYDDGVNYLGDQGFFIYVDTPIYKVQEDMLEEELEKNLSKKYKKVLGDIAVSNDEYGSFKIYVENKKWLNDPKKLEELYEAVWHAGEETLVALNSANEDNLIDVVLNTEDHEEAVDHYMDVMKRAGYSNTWKDALEWFRNLDDSEKYEEYITFRMLELA